MGEPKKLLPKSMTNRYFSVENAIKDTEPTTSSAANSTETNEKQDTPNPEPQPQDSEQFIKKRDYLLNKLLQSRNLPDPALLGNPTEAAITQSPVITSTVESEATTSKATETHLTDATVTAKAKTSTPSFQDEYIPLFSTKVVEKEKPRDNNNENENDDETVVIENYEHSEQDEEDVIDITEEDSNAKIYNGKFILFVVVFVCLFLTLRIKMSKSSFKSHIFVVNKLPTSHSALCPKSYLKFVMRLFI